MKKIFHFMALFGYMSCFFIAKGSESSKLSKYLYLTDIIQQFDISILLVTDEDMNQTISENFDLDINGKIAFFCGRTYNWKKINRNFYLIEKKNLKCNVLSMNFSDMPNDGASKVYEYLLLNKIIFFDGRSPFFNRKNIHAENINILDFLADKQNNLMLISVVKLTEEQEDLLWRQIEDIPKWASKIKRDNEPFWYFMVKDIEKIPKTYQGEDIADGSSLASCKLKLIEGQKFELTVKNSSSQRLIFSKFNTENVIINDIASDGKFFEIDELGMFLVYPPLDSALPEEFYLEPSEEKVFTFPLVGSRSKENKGKLIWDIGVEKEYDYKPDKDCTILTRRNKKYNLYGIVVYFYDETGKKYKTFNKDLINSTGWPEQ